MNYWLIKTEPGNYSWEDLKKDKQTFWDGVRNYQARNNLKAMKEGDLCLYYHSVNEKCTLGVAKVIREFYQDPTTEDERWVAVDVAPDFEFKKRSLDMGWQSSFWFSGYRKQYTHIYAPGTRIIA